MNPPIPNPQALLGAALAHLRAGRLAEAQSRLAQVLAQWPDEPDALQLLGLVHKRRGEQAQAEACWRRSLARRPAQPHVMNNLGNLLVAVGRAAEAEPLFRQALALNPGYADAHFNLARLLLAQGDRDGASQSLEQAFRHAPQAGAGLYQLQAQLHSQAGELDEALACLDQALQRPGATGLVLHDRGVVLHRMGRDAEALQAHDQAMQAGVDHADAHYNRGNVLQALGRQAEAVLAYRAALQRQPLHGLALYDLARLRWRQGDGEPDAELVEAQRLHPAQAAPHAIRAHLLWRAGRLAAAADDYRAALQRQPADAALMDGLGRCLVRLGQLDEGLALQRQAVERDPHRAEHWVQLGASLLEAGRPHEALPLLERAVGLAPLDQHAWALLGAACRCCGDPREGLFEDPALVGVHQLPTPEGWPRLDDFLDALCDELDALHRDREAPVDQTLRHGTQTTGTLFRQGHRLTAVLQGLLGTVIDRHLAGLAAQADHPFLGRWSPRWRFTDSWSSRLRHSGFHVDHVHPHGWLSGVVYLRLPAACDDDVQRAGWLRFGHPDLDLSRLPLPPTRLPMVQPLRGRVVLFPSSTWHGTTPFTGTDDRLTVAFDVLPLAHAPAVSV